MNHAQRVAAYFGKKRTTSKPAAKTGKRAAGANKTDHARNVNHSRKARRVAVV